MNVGGVDVLDAFGGRGKSKRLETTRYATKVRWLGLRPSQLDKLKSSNSPESRKLTHTSFFNALRKFGKHRNTRLDLENIAIQGLTKITQHLVYSSRFWGVMWYVTNARRKELILFRTKDVAALNKKQKDWVDAADELSENLSRLERMFVNYDVEINELF